MELLCPAVRIGDTLGLELLCPAVRIGGTLGLELLCRAAPCPDRRYSRTGMVTPVRMTDMLTGFIDGIDTTHGFELNHCIASLAHVKELK